MGEEDRLHSLSAATPCRRGFTLFLKSYDELAYDYDRRWRKYVDASLEWGMAGVAFAGGERVLNVACGTGALEARLLAQRPELSLHGVDASAPMVYEARRKLGAVVGWVAADAHALPYPDATFEHVFCFNSMHYFADAARCLAESARVLVPGGAFWLLDWCDDYWACKLCSLWLQIFEPAFKKTYGLHQARELMTDAGFKVTLAERSRISPLWGLMRLRGIRR